jgi:transposase
MKMRFEEIYERYKRSELGSCEAADLLGISDRTFRRKKCRYEEEGFAGLLDRRIGNVPPNKVAVDEVEEMLSRYQKDYYDFNPRHFHSQLVKKHNFKRSYNFVRLSLQGSGLVPPSKIKKNPHRKKRPRKSMEGMMIHQDGSTHEWIVGLGYHPDLIVTMDDATSKVYSAFLCEEEGTDSTFRALTEVITENGLFCSFYTDRGSHYAYTPEAGGKVDKTKPTQVGRACKQLGIQCIYAYSPEARGRSERLFGTWQNRLPQELRLNGVKTIAEANRYIKEVFIPEFNDEFSVEAESEKTAFVPYVGRDLRDILSIQEERTVAKDNTISYKTISLQIPSDNIKYHYVKCKVMVHEYYNGDLAISYGPRILARYTSSGKMIDAQQTNAKERGLPTAA